MARLGEKMAIGDRGYEYEIDLILKEPDSGLVRVMERRSGVDSYLFTLPATVWDAAVRGARPFPTDEELKKLKAEHEHRHWESCDRDEAARNYIEALEARVRELMGRLEG